jgi:Xaa-Pro dipeptidase
MLKPIDVEEVNDMLITKEGRDFYKVPPFADFPKGEFDRRMEGARKAMSEKGVDALILWDAHNIRYFCGFNSTHWDAKSLQCAVLVLPLDRDPVIVIPDFFRGQAEATTYLRDIRGYEHPHHSSSLRGVPREVANVVREMGYGKKRIGLEDGTYANMFIPRPVSDIDLLRSELSGATFVEGADVIWQCRMVKSDLEIEAIKMACALCTEAFSEFVENFSLGMTEKEAGALLYSGIVRRGLLPAGMFFSADPSRYPMADSSPSYEGVPINRGNHLIVEGFGCYKGYMGGVGRCLEIGEISDKKWEYILACEHGQDAALASIRDGVDSNEVQKAMDRGLREKGFTRTFAGHGIGLTGHEIPALTNEKVTVLKKGMVLAVETWIFDIKGFARGGRIDLPPEQWQTNLGQFGMEEYVVVTEDGYEMMPNFPREIRTIPR